MTKVQRAQVRPSGLCDGLSNLNCGQTSSIRPSKPPVFCLWCAGAFGREQELKRHILSRHLPYWICCPHPLCSWRGTRTEELKKHMRKGRCGPEAKREQYMIYKPKQVFDHVFDGSDDTFINAKLRFAELFALLLVFERMIELRKVDLWEAPWGEGDGCCGDGDATPVARPGRATL
jgi:hypothetical protein